MFGLFFIIPLTALIVGATTWIVVLVAKACFGEDTDRPERTGRVVVIRKSAGPRTYFVRAREIDQFQRQRWTQRMAEIESASRSATSRIPEFWIDDLQDRRN